MTGRKTTLRQPVARTTPDMGKLKHLLVMYAQPKILHPRFPSLCYHLRNKFGATARATGGVLRTAGFKMGLKRRDLGFNVEETLINQLCVPIILGKGRTLNGKKSRENRCTKTTVTVNIIIEK